MDLWLLLGVCGIATYLWRGPGVLIAARLDSKGEAFMWISCVAYAIIAGLVARMLVLPTGALSETTALERVLGSVVALAVYFRLSKRNLLAGVLASALAFSLIRMAT